MYSKIYKILSVIPVDILAVTKELGINVYSSEDFDRTDLYAVEEINDELSILISTNVPITEQRFNLAKALYYYINHNK